LEFELLFEFQFADVT